ncbi:hypothetical protein R1flu_010932 [Riccia fluitans]|uniref:BING4 C-terminal domain-containing protein n=1 Tax=Riccia fluitans TaxID=41844 RepID=A0ABD1Z6J6_9MARC
MKKQKKFKKDKGKKQRMEAGKKIKKKSKNDKENITPSVAKGIAQKLQEEGAQLTPEIVLRKKKYERGPAPKLTGMSDKKLKGQLQEKEKLYGEAAVTAAQAEQWLLPSEGGYLEAEDLEQTKNFTQQAIVKEVDITSARKAFDLQLEDLAPYTLDYNNNGKYLLIGGRKGHLAIMDWKQSKLIMETQVTETVRDVKFLHNELFFAVAQKKYTFIYDKQGVEIHCLRDHLSTLKLEFLPHHFLLASVDKAGILRYQDTSTGQLVGFIRSQLGRCGVMRMNPYNSVIGLGHNNGTVTMWSPNMQNPLVSMLCHKGPVTAIAYDSEGRHMVTAGIDGKVKIWDARKFSPLHFYFAPTAAKSLDISQRGLLAMSSGSGIQIWRDALTEKQSKPYMMHRVPKGAQVQDIAFCPYEDVMAIGHGKGVSSILVPGAGEPNFDSYVSNPYQTLKQRREAEVHKLLDKLQPEMIVLDPEEIGAVQKSAKEIQQTKGLQANEANAAIAEKLGLPVKTPKEKKKTKGRSKASKRLRRKESNIITIKRALIAEQVKGASKSQSKDKDTPEVPLPRALQRFKGPGILYLCRSITKFGWNWVMFLDYASRSITSLETYWANGCPYIDSADFELRLEGSVK